MSIAMMFMGVCAQAQNYSYVKVTSAPTDWSGEYLIVYEGDASHDAVALNGSLSSLDDAKNGVKVTISSNVITGSDAINAATFTIAQISGTTNYSVKSASGYYIGATKTENKLRFSDSDVYANSIELSGTNAVIKSFLTGTAVTLRYNYAVDQLRFRYYKSGQQAVALYKKVVPMTITSATWASFSSASEVAIPEGVTAYYASASDGSSVTLKEITTGIIPANEGVVINGTAKTYYANISATDADNVTGNLLKPNVTAGTPSGTYYTLAAGPTFKLSSGGTLAAGKSYLVVPDGARELTINFDETTAIQNIERATVTDNRYYTLDGREVKNPTKGIYIVNGKKVVIR